MSNEVQSESQMRKTFAEFRKDLLSCSNRRGKGLPTNILKNEVYTSVILAAPQKINNKRIINRRQNTLLLLHMFYLPHYQEPENYYPGYFVLHIEFGEYSYDIKWAWPNSRVQVQRILSTACEEKRETKNPRARISCINHFWKILGSKRAYACLVLMIEALDKDLVAHT